MDRILTDAGAKELAAELFPELTPLIGAHFGLMPGGGQIVITPGFNDYTCQVFVQKFNDTVLTNGELFFTELEKSGEIGSLGLTQAIGVARPSDIPFVLTTPLKRRTKAIGLGKQVPWTPATSPDGRTVWRDRDGIAGRMVKAIKQEQARRAAAQKP
jgi:hypothetical protein